MPRNINALMSSKSDEWATPWDIFADLDEEFHLIFDPACTSDNAKCQNRCCHDEGTDGLAADWRPAVVKDEEDRFKYAVFLNPPHSNITAWVEKAVAEARRGARVVGLIPANTDTIWWHRYIMDAREIRFVERRISFTGIIKKPGQPKDLPEEQVEYVMGTAPSTFPSAIVIWDDIRWDARGRPKMSSYIQPKNRGKEIATPEALKVASLHPTAESTAEPIDETPATPATEPVKKPRKPRKKSESASSGACRDVENVVCGGPCGGEMANMYLASEDPHVMFEDGM